MREGLGKIVPTDDTIVAIATPQGRSGIGVVRLSGDLSQSIAQRFLMRPTSLTHRHASVGLWTDSSGAVIDEVVATLFNAPHSYTGEDVLEISAHGNPLILRNIVETVRSAGARLAAPGEFTLRAVIHGKMDLIQAEAVRHFIDAQTDMQARTARLQMGGALSKQILPVREQLVDIIAHLEAGIDFADDDVQPPEDSVIICRIDPMLNDLQKLQESYSFGRLLFSGLRVAIIGKPNVGKSSLFNRLVGANRAIVSSIPGTTRDVLRENVSLEGVPLQFLDTAGMRNTSDPIEAMGVEKSEEALAEADLVLFVIDGASGLDDSDRNILSRIVNSNHLLIVNKCDLPQVVNEEMIGESRQIRVSAKTGEGMGDLENAMRGFVGNPGGEIPGSIVTSARHFEAICGALRALGKGRLAMAQGTPHEMVLLDLYESLSALNELTGDVVTEDILGRIFSTFCVGK